MHGHRREKQKDLDIVFAKLKENEMTAIDLTDNELAKSHLKQLVGGRSVIEKERLFSFNFSEKPLAIHQFLDQLTNIPAGGPFNLTMLNYRNIGGDVGRKKKHIFTSNACIGWFILIKQVEPKIL